MLIEPIWYKLQHYKKYGLRKKVILLSQLWQACDHNGRGDEWLRSDIEGRKLLDLVGEIVVIVCPPAVAEGLSPFDERKDEK